MRKFYLKNRLTDYLYGDRQKIIIIKLNESTLIVMDKNLENKSIEYFKRSENYKDIF